MAFQSSSRRQDDIRITGFVTEIARKAQLHLALGYKGFIHFSGFSFKLAGTCILQ
jgi:hypothetical protein